jgi:prepilin-type N-terminal cleavage/methylation domain-containing protein
MLRDGPAILMRTRTSGFTLIELLVAMALFLVLGAITLTAIVSLSKGLDRERVTSDITSEARVALDRMAREVRQAEKLENPLPGSMKLSIDFDGNGVIDGSLADPEVVTYAHDSANDSIAMTAMDPSGTTVTAALLAGQVKDLTFKYRSSNWQEYGPDDDVSNPADVDRVIIDLTVERDGQDEVFRTQVTLRNRSQS